MPVNFRILSLDGGGIRGLLTAIVLERLERECPGWLDKVDLIAGTSTGGIIALGLANGLTPTDLRELYEKKGPDIFDDSWLDELLDVGKVAGADYDNKNLSRELKNRFGQTQLKDLRKRVLIPSFDMDNEKEGGKRSWDAKFFHNYPGKDSDSDQLVWKVALYTSAAPTYFPSVEGYVDGGVVANNPAMAALAQTQDSRALKSPPAFKDIVMLSLGTGWAPSYITGTKLDWGYAQWAKPLVNVMLDGLMNVADYQCRQILKENYFRFQPILPQGEPFRLDDASPKKIKQIVAFAENLDIDEVVKWITTSWL